MCWVKLSTVLTDTTANRKLASVTVELQRKSGSSWVPVKTDKTSTGGKASVTVTPSATTTYTWSVVAGVTGGVYYGAATSPAFTVSVKLAASQPTITGTANVGHKLIARPGT
jgi:5-hydroxyisourate hydrolase-like protein (transthyretin family)